MNAVDRVRRHQTAISVTILALLAYLPSLTAAPGRMPTDSKLYVYLDPGRFIADTTTTFDPRQFAGWVPHQHIAYLWPTGPWYWLFETLGFPDWIAHRLWIGTLLFVAGLGVRWMIRVLGFIPLAALAGAVVYQLSPYILPYVSRTSVLLLPFAGLGWIVGLTIMATRRRGWGHPAAIALVVLTVGAVNATALAMIIPGPVLWLLHAAWGRLVSWRDACIVGLRVAALSIGVSLWWMSMLIVQGRYGADVLAYSESLESVSFTSTSTEVGRGLGYWLFYVRDAFGATTTASVDHMLSVRVVLAGFVLTAVGAAGIVFVRTPHRRFAGLLFGTGIVLGVGVHPINDPSPLMSLLVGDGEGGLALALRSSTRAVPVLLLGSAIGAASLVSAVGALAQSRGLKGRLPGNGASLRVGLAAIVVVLAVVNLPALRTGGFIDPSLERDQTPPQHWLDATAALDELPEGRRVLQVPGAEFGAFDWGFTVDQPLPGLTERPLITRDLLPLGSPAAMDLAFALDDRFQEGTIEPESVVAVARLLGVDTVWISGDIQSDRFGLARPEIVTDELTSSAAIEAGLIEAVTFGDPVAPSPLIPVVDAQSLSDQRVGEAIAPITLVTIDQAVPTVRVKDRTIVVSGSGDGLIDAAVAGLIDGTEAIIYSASTLGDDDPFRGAEPSRLIVTDANRKRAHQWRSSQDVLGFTEAPGPDGGVMRVEPADQRLPVFADAPTDIDPSTQTVSIQRGPVTARASAYGESFAYRPEHRAVMAVDGDPATAWLVADRAPATGEFIELTLDGTIDHLDLLQPPTRPGQRVITGVAVAVDGGPLTPIALTDLSLVGTGQRVDIAPTAATSTLRLTITSTSDPQPPIADAIGAVGFAEISTGLAPTTEWIRPPLDGLDRYGELPTDLVFSRLRTEPTDRWRLDPEPVLRREFDLPRPLDADLAVTLRFDRRAAGGILSELLGEPATSNRHLTGAPSARAAAAFDGDPATAWTTPFVTPVGSSISYAGEAGNASTLTLEQPVGEYSPITSLQIDDGGDPFEVILTSSEIALPRPIDTASFTATITGIEERITVDRRYAEPFVLPAAVSEIRFDGVSPALAPVERFTADCRTDLLTIDDEPVGLSFDIAVDDALAGDPIDATVCVVPSFGEGGHRIESSSPAIGGFHVDRVTVSESSISAAVPSNNPPASTLVDASSRSRTLDVAACPDGCWVVLGEGFNEAWSARSDATGDLGSPVLIDGNANGWWIPPTDEMTRVEFDWTAQRPLNIAFLLSGLSILLAIGLILRDRRTRHLSADEHDAWRCGAEPEQTVALSVFRPAIVTGVVAAAGGALLIGWTWGLAVGVVWAACTLLRRPQIAGWIGWAVMFSTGLIVTQVVRTERPFPNAGWPVRFEYLHGWTLLGVVLITCSSLLPSTSPAPPPVIDDPEDDD